MTYITVTDVRRASGAPTSLITDAYITSIIEVVEGEMERWVNTKFTPTQTIEALDGSGSNRFFTHKNPVLAVRGLNTNDTDITLSSINIYKESGKIELGGDSETSQFIAKSKDTIIKYHYGLLDESSTNTTTSAASVAGTSVALSVASETGFVDEDWVEIYGMDGNKEVAQINTNPTTGVITVDQLVQAHESGSIVVKLQIPFHIKRYMEIEAALSVAINAIGATYTFNASYSLGDLSVVKGVPYTHWQSSVEKLLKEREMRKSRIKIRPHIVV